MDSIARALDFELRDLFPIPKLKPRNKAEAEHRASIERLIQSVESMSAYTIGRLAAIAAILEQPSKIKP